MTWQAATNHSWEQLTALAAAHRRRSAGLMKQHMIAANGDQKSWTSLVKLLDQIIKVEM